MIALVSKLVYRFYQKPNWLLCRNWKAGPKIHMEIYGTQDTQNSIEKEEQSCKTFISPFQNLIQNYGDHNSGVLA